MVDSPQDLRRPSSAAGRPRPDPNADAVATTTTIGPAPDTPRARRGVCKPQDGKMQKSDDAPPTPMMPPPLTSTEPDSTTRPSCSDVGAFRATNRLSLTLPIAPHAGDRSRPAPTPAASFSVPPTPIETPTIPLPADANEFIRAIAVQERRVLELREELVRAEENLARLKGQWTVIEPFFNPGAAHQAELLGNSAPGPLDDAATGPRRSLDLDRRKLMLQNQTQGTPSQGNRRRLFRGGHTRALSLLSPARPTSEFSMHETPGREAADPSAVQLAFKRASWQPLSVQNSPSVPRLVEDFKVGLKAFVEEVRQITLGDEPIGGQPARRGPPSVQQGRATNRGSAGSTGRPRAGVAPMGPNSNVATPTPASRFAVPSLEKPKSVKSKPFSWTPLGFDSLDDDWGNWESPGPTKSPRWSDSTINGAGLEDIGPIPEMREESMTPARKAEAANAEALIIHPKLEEIIPNLVNRLSPGNLKRTANSLMDEWERSLISSGSGDKENEALET